MDADPVAPQFRRRWLVGCSVLWTAAVAYGSLVPLDYAPIGFDEAVARFREIPFLHLGVAKRADWVANGLLFVPVGLFGAAALSPRGGLRPGAILPAIFVAVVAAAFAILLEFVQLWFPGRTVSQNDILAEAIGSATGAMLWPVIAPTLWKQLPRIRSRAAGGEPLPLGLKAYVIALLVYSVMPLDIVLSASDLERKWQDGKIDLGFDASAFDPTRSELWKHVALFFPVGVYAGIRAGRPGFARHLQAFGTGFAILGLVEFAQLFVFSRYFSLSHVLAAGLGVVGGVAVSRRVPVLAAAAVRAIRDNRPSRRRLWAFSAAAYAGLLLFGLWTPFAGDFASPASVLDEFLAVPFSRLYRGTEFNALQQILAKAALFLPFGFSVSQAAGSDRSRRIVAALAVGAFCVAAELGQGVLTSRICDVTDSLLYAVGAAFGSALSHRIRTGSYSADPRPTPAAAVRLQAPLCSLSAGHSWRVRFWLGGGIAGVLLVIAGGVMVTIAQWSESARVSDRPLTFDVRSGTRFTDRPLVPYSPPRVERIALPDFLGASAIWGATGRDSRGKIWLGVSAGDRPGASTRLLAYDPASRRVTDHGDVLGQLRRSELLRPGERQNKIHTKIIEGPDGFLYFASTDEQGEADDGTQLPTWGSHLWRYRPPESEWGRFASRWEHLAAVPEGLIALAGGDRFIFALGLWNHVLYRFDTDSGALDSVVVGSVGGHVSRNFLADHRGHVYVPRLRSVVPEATAERLGLPREDRVRVTLVEFDENLREVAETPIHDYVTASEGTDHGITAFTVLADRSLLFLTAVGALYRVDPVSDGPAAVERLGWFHPDGPTYAASLFTYSGRWYAVGAVERRGGRYDWVTFDLENRRSITVPLEWPDGGRGARYGCLTRDDTGAFYMAGRGSLGRRSEPVLLRLVPEI